MILSIVLVMLLLISSVGLTCVGHADPHTKMHYHQSYIDAATDGKTAIAVSKLPNPYDHLLTQPLMTIGLQNFYRLTSSIKKINEFYDSHNMTYSRAVIMLVDANQDRNDPGLAKLKNEDKIIEFATITINLKVLPTNVVNDILESDIPFGKLLFDNHIQVSSQNRQYFTLKCNAKLAAIMHCYRHDLLYGRKNILVLKDNNTWVATVEEILAKP